jgi:N6-adenosine-specific RNA methylase IME4
MSAPITATPATARNGEPASDVDALRGGELNIDTSSILIPQVGTAGKLEFHPLADIFPLIEGKEFDDLVADIKAHGVREPIWIYEGEILDGRNRYLASAIAGIDCPMREYHGEDPVAFVLSLNLKRRHLNESQRAMVAAKLANLGDGQRADQVQGTSIEVASTLLNVGRASIERAKSVQRDAAPELLAAVEQGHLAVSAAAAATKLSEEDQREIAAKATAGEANAVRKVLKRKQREQKEKALGSKQIALPQKRYGVILADPEWKFETWSPLGLVNSSPDNHYPTSELDVIKARDVPSISADDSVLFLWATVPTKPQALEVMAAWGFEYKSQCVWVKDRAGTGYWFRNQHEILLVGTRGKIPAPAPGTQWSSVIEAPVGEHSAKPEKFLELIEAYFPTLPKIELNRRWPPRAGWDAWGNEAIAALAYDGGARL